MAISALGQSTDATPPVPDAVMFQFFFQHVLALERSADALKAKGREDGGRRSMIRLGAHLTSQEEATVKGFARSCIERWTNETRREAAEAAPLLRGSRGPNDVPPATQSELDALELHRQQVMSACVAELAAKMKPSRFRPFTIMSSRQKRT